MESNETKTPVQIAASTPLPWNTPGVYVPEIFSASGCRAASCNGVATHIKDDVQNAAAIVSAVNNTFGAGINPEAVPKMKAAVERVIALRDLLIYPNDTPPEHQEEARALADLLHMCENALNI